MTDQLQIKMVQCNSTVGAIRGNTQLILSHIQANTDADLIIFPELALCGYPPEDLLFRDEFYQAAAASLEQIIAHIPAGQHVIIGHPYQEDNLRFNSASIIDNNGVVQRYDKQALPNYTLFDEKRYFTPGSQPCQFEVHGHRFGLIICEDVWTDEAVEQVAPAVDTLIVINASPYSVDKHLLRTERARVICQSHHCNLSYTNLVGGQDEIVFEGLSFVMNQQGNVCGQAIACEEQTLSLTIDPTNNKLLADITASTDKWETLYASLVLGLKDYINKNHFPGVLLGLSGGIDSALTLAIAVDALGPDRVTAVMMPSRHTSELSLQLAQQQAETMGVTYQVIDIEPAYQSFIQSLQPIFANKPKDITEENLQARCRGVLLMALSNKLNQLVLSTGNKSELAVGYSTLYGDMVGGFAPLKDIYKTTVYALCDHRNQLSAVIPAEVITRAPSAELADDQTDQDTLPPYDILDQILELFITQELSAHDIIQQGFDKTQVADTIRRVYRNEYKRRQGPIGVRTSTHAFGKDRRYPITNGFIG